MFDETDSDFDSSVDALLSWKPPKPTIDIDDIAEIERFLFGDQISLDMVCTKILHLLRYFILLCLHLLKWLC